MGDFAYAVTRIRARRARLLPPEAYRQLLNMELPEIARYIQELEYRREIDRFGASRRGVDLLEAALSANLSTAVGEMLDFCGDALRTQLEAYVERYRVANLKHLLRGAFRGLSVVERMQQVSPLSERDRARCRRLAGAENVPAMVELLAGSPYQAVLREALDARAGESLQPLEDALHQIYYQRLLKRLPKGEDANRLYRAFVSLEIDVVNLKTVLRLRHRETAGHAELLIAGGTLALEPLAATHSIDDVLAALEGTPFHGLLQPPLAKIAKRGLNPVVLVLEQYLAARAARFSYLYPLSLLPIIDYLLRKEREMRNLRAIVRGRELGLARERIEELLVI